MYINKTIVISAALLAMAVCGCSENKITFAEEGLVHNEQSHVFDLGQDGQKFDSLGTGILKPMNHKDVTLHTTCVTSGKKIIITSVNAETKTNSATIQLRNVPQGLRIVKALALEANNSKAVSKDVKMIFVCGEYNFNVTLPGDSTLTILCEFQN